MSALLAVDAGIRTGLALFDGNGRLVWCRSHNLGNMTRLKKAAGRILSELPDLEYVVVEGGGQAAGIWEHAAVKHGLIFRLIQAEQWRADFLLPRQRQSGHKAKTAACVLAEKIMRAEGRSSPTPLRHDAAEAVLIGLWAMARLGKRNMPMRTTHLQKTVEEIS
jgi:hypothetical protein